jgi:hypothetical protein
MEINYADYPVDFEQRENEMAQTLRKFFEDTEKEIKIIVDQVEGTIRLATNYYVKPSEHYFNGLNTTAKFPDGEVITVKPSDKDKYDKEVGLAMCIVKRIFGSRAAWLRFVESGQDQNQK